MRGRLLHRVPRPKIDETALPDLKYLSFVETPITSPEGHSRKIDDVQELLVRKYLEHLQYLEVKKSKQKDDRKRQRETDSQKKYADYNWEEMFIAGTLKKLEVSSLNLFLEKHQLGNKKMKKNDKLVLFSACLAKDQLNKATIEQAARKVNVEENVDLHDGEHEEETGDDDDDYDSVHTDDTDGDDNNDCDDNEYEKRPRCSSLISWKFQRRRGRRW